MEEYKDITLVCKDCGTKFVYTKGEQKFIDDLKKADKISVTARPVRCVDCKIQRKKLFEKKNFENNSY